MSETTAAQAINIDVAGPASFEDVKTLCPGADNDFIVGQLERKSTADQAQSCWMEEQNRRLAAKDQELAASKQQRATARAPGVEAIEQSSGPSKEDASDPIEAWESRLREEMDKGCSKSQASSILSRRDPHLRVAYVEAYNLQHLPNQV